MALVRELDEPEARKPSRDLVSSGPGRDQESANAARHAIEPRHDAHREAERAFLLELAQDVHAEAIGNTFDRLVLAAPPQAMGVLRAALSPAVRRKLVAEVTKDLTRTPLADLPPHFAAALRG